MVDESDYRCGVAGRETHRLPVVISGCSGGGKSSILAELGRRGYHVIPEAGRQIVREQLFIGSDGLPWQEFFVSDRERQHTFEEAVEEYESLIPF